MAALGAGDIELTTAARDTQQLLAALALEVFVFLALLPANLIFRKGGLELIIELQKGSIFGAALFKLTGHHAEDGIADPQNSPCIKERQGIEPGKHHADQRRLHQKGRKLVGTIAPLHLTCNFASEILHKLIHKQTPGFFILCLYFKHPIDTGQPLCGNV